MADPNHLNITEWRRVMATTSHTGKETGSSSSQVPTTAARNHVEEQRRDQEDRVADIGAHHSRKKTEVDRSLDTY